MPPSYVFCRTLRGEREVLLKVSKGPFFKFLGLIYQGLENSTVVIYSSSLSDCILFMFGLYILLYCRKIHPTVFIRNENTSMLPGPGFQRIVVNYNWS